MKKFHITMVVEAEDDVTPTQLSNAMYGLDERVHYDIQELQVDVMPS